MITKKANQFTSEFTNPLEATEVMKDLGRAQLRELARDHEILTEYGSAAYTSKLKARSAAYTRTTVGNEVTDEDRKTILEVQEYLKKQTVIEVDRQMCQGPVDKAFACRLWVTKPYARLAHMFHASLGPIDGSFDVPDLRVIDVPEWEGERRILVDPDAGVTYVLGSDYYGEIKKGFLRMVMYRAKQAGGLGLHAGSKEVWAKSHKTGELTRSGILFFGLSGTGKTSLTCHDFNMDEVFGEKTRVRQDDVVILEPNGAARGTEIEGFYIKTEGLNPVDQKALLQAATSQCTVFENVAVDKETGKVDFDDTKYSKNARAVAPVRQVINTDGDIDLPKANKIFFITRNPLSPPISRLTKEQAALAFMLGESIKTSAADPNAKGEPVREVGTNPFIVGSYDEEGNRFYEILSKNPEIECFLLNTGKVGEGETARKIKILETVAIIRAVARDAIEWKRDETLNVEIPISVEGVPMEEFAFDRVWGNGLDEKLTHLRSERKAWLDQFSGLKSELMSSLLLGTETYQIIQNTSARNFCVRGKLLVGSVDMKFWMKFLFLGLAATLCFSASRVQAQEESENGTEKPQIYDLAAAIRQAMKISPAVDSAEFDEAAAKAQLDEATFAGIVPKFEVNVLGGFVPDVPEGLGPANGFPEVDLPWTNLGPFLQIRAEAFQPIYTFGKISNLRKAAKLGLEAKTEGINKARNELVYQVKRAYIGLTALYSFEEFIKDLQGRSKKAKELMQKQIQKKSSEVTDIDLMRVEVFEAETERRLVDIENGINFTTMSLKVLMGLPRDQKIDIADRSLKMDETQVASIDRYLRTAKKNRPEIQQLEDVVGLREAAMKGVRAGFFPTLGTAAFYRYGFAPDRDPARNPFLFDNFNFHSGGAFLVLNQKLNFWMTNTRYKKARALYSKAVADQNRALQGIEIEIRKAHTDAIAKKQAVDAAKKGFKSGRSWVLAATLNFGIGVGPPKDLIEAFVGYSTVKFNYLQTVNDYHMALAKLSKVVGQEVTNLHWQTD